MLLPSGLEQERERASNRRRRRRRRLWNHYLPRLGLQQQLLCTTYSAAPCAQEIGECNDLWEKANVDDDDIDDDGDFFFNFSLFNRMPAKSNGKKHTGRRTDGWLVVEVVPRMQ